MEPEDQISLNFNKRSRHLCSKSHTSENTPELPYMWSEMPQTARAKSQRLSSQSAIVSSTTQESSSPLSSPTESVTRVTSCIVPSPSCSCHDLNQSGFCFSLRENRYLERIFQKLMGINPLSKSGLLTQLSLVLFVLSFTLDQSQARSVGLCRGVPCANNGQLMVDNSVWGHCRCRCPRGFVGPYCQYRVPAKRSSGNRISDIDNPVGTSDRLDTLRHIRNQLVALNPTLFSPPVSRDRSVNQKWTADDFSQDYHQLKGVDNTRDGVDSTKRPHRPFQSRSVWYPNSHMR